MNVPVRYYVAAVVGLSIATALVGAGVANAQARDDAREDALEDASYAAEQAAARVSEDLAIIQATVASTAANPSISQAFTDPDCTLTFAGAGSFATGHLDVVRPDGSVACSSQPESESTVPVYDAAGWLAEPLEAPVLRAPVVDPTTGAQALISAAPIAGGGLVVLVASLDAVGPSLEALYGGPDELEFVVTSADGEAALSRSIDAARWAGVSLRGTPFAPQPGLEEGSDVDGTERLYATATVDPLGWQLYAGADLEMTLASASSLFERQLLFILAGTALVLLVALVVYRQIARPIQELSRDVRTAATRPDPTVMTVRGPAEIAGLADEINGLLEAVDRDVSERNRVANRELESFSYSVSHDLRAPVRAIHGFASILMAEHGEEFGAEATRYLDRVKVNAELMTELIDDLLEFSRLGRAAIRKQVVDPTGLVEEALGLVADERKGNDAEVIIHDLPRCLADPGLLRLVYVNLLSNALKYGRGRPAARVEVGATELDGATTYYVKDNGVGFDMRYAGKLFGVFERLHTDEEYEGTGVGLATARRIIERHGGSIWAEGRTDEGATFFFTLGGTDAVGTRWRGDIDVPGRPLELTPVG